MRYFEEPARVVEVIDHKRYWREHVRASLDTFGSAGRRLRIAANLDSVDWDVYNLNDYLFTHNTIVASCAHSDDGHTITAGSVQDVNKNNNAWYNEVVGPPTLTYKSFVGAQNYYEHVQCPQYSKGRILDAALRKAKNADNEDIHVVDILVATHRRHRDLVARIEKKNLNTLSMGCIANVTQCSKCGQQVRNDADECFHLRYEIGNEYRAPQGFTSKVAESCGVAGDPQSCVFIEASWVESPAYKGAVVHHMLNNSLELIDESRLATDTNSNVIRLADHVIDLSAITANDLDALSRVRVADRHGMLSLRLLVSSLKEKVASGRVERLAGLLARS